jgi:predicted enzyme related to lactoylglutathione lyase
MITGIHSIVHTKDAEADRAFFRDVLGFPSVDAGHGWLIFALPPAELACHPTEGTPRQELYLMCDDVAAAVDSLREKGIDTGPINEAGWGRVTMLTTPGGAEIGLYQPRHPTAIADRPPTDR